MLSLKICKNGLRLLSLVSLQFSKKKAYLKLEFPALFHLPLALNFNKDASEKCHQVAQFISQFNQRFQFDELIEKSRKYQTENWARVNFMPRDNNVQEIVFKIQSLTNDMKKINQIFDDGPPYHDYIFEILEAALPADKSDEYMDFYLSMEEVPIRMPYVKNGGDSLPPEIKNKESDVRSCHDVLFRKLWTLLGQKAIAVQKYTLAFVNVHIFEDNVNILITPLEITLKYWEILLDFDVIEGDITGIRSMLRLERRALKAGVIAAQIPVPEFLHTMWELKLGITRLADYEMDVSATGDYNLLNDERNC